MCYSPRLGSTSKTQDASSASLGSDVPAPPKNAAVGGKASLQPERTTCHGQRNRCYTSEQNTTLLEMQQILDVCDFAFVSSKHRTFPSSICDFYFLVQLGGCV